MKQYTKTHEWVEVASDGTAYVGISKFAADELGEIVFVDLPEEGQKVAAGESFCEIESVKAVAEVNSPVSGTICKVNDALADSPELLSGGGEWICAITLSEPVGELMDEAAYEASLN